MTEPAIADLEICGDLQTAALMPTDGSIGSSGRPGLAPPDAFGALLDAAPNRPTPGAGQEVRHG